MAVMKHNGHDKRWRRAIPACLALLWPTFQSCAAAIAKPLDQDACLRLKTQRDALEASGARSALAEHPPTRVVKTLDERGQRMSTLIQIDGQLRFRCNTELPITTLKPEALVEVPDTVDGETVSKPPLVKRPSVKKAKAVPPTAENSTSGEAGQPAVDQRKAAKSATTMRAPTTEPSELPKARPKPKSKVDDAFRAPAAKPDTATAPQ